MNFYVATIGISTSGCRIVQLKERCIWMTKMCLLGMSFTEDMQMYNNVLSNERSRWKYLIASLCAEMDKVDQVSIIIDF